MNWFKRLVGVALAAPLCAFAAQPTSDWSWNQRGSQWASWEGSTLRASRGEWLWTSEQNARPLTAIVFGAPRPYVLFAGAFEREANHLVPRLRRTTARGLPVSGAADVMAAIRRSPEAAVPEPGTWIMIGLGAGFALWNARRRRRAL